jgi:hypothetical protein
MSENIPSRPTPPAEFARLSSQNTSSFADRHNADLTASQQRLQNTGDRFNRNDEAQVDLSPAGREALAAGQLKAAETDNDNQDGFNRTRDDRESRQPYGLQGRESESRLAGAREQTEEQREREREQDQRSNNPVENAVHLSPSEIVGTQDAVARLDRNEDGRIDRSEQYRALRERESGGDARLRLYQQTAELVGSTDTDIIEDPEVDTDRELFGFAAANAEEEADNRFAAEQEPIVQEQEKISDELPVEEESTVPVSSGPPNSGFAA